MDNLSSDPPRAALLLRIVAETRRELHKGRPAVVPTLASTLDRDLGFDSLARVELLARTERAFGVRLPAATLQEAQTVGDLLAAVDAAPARDDSVPLPVAPAALPTGGDEGVPTAAQTLTEALAWHAARHPGRVQIVHLDDTGESRIDYGSLQAEAERVAGGLQAAGLLPGQTVAIMLPTSPDYFYAYFGILLAGGVPVPIYPPARLSQLEEHVRRHAGILANAEASLLLTVPEAMPVARLLEAHVPGLRRVSTVAALRAAGATLAPVRARPDDIAFIQYTSGSTGDPKGVVLSHANLLANIRAIGAALEVGPQDVAVSWLPLYHDMGLIAAWLSSLYYGIPLVVMSPLRFLARPEAWLQAIHRYRGTLTAAPNFAYELCCKRIDDATLAGFDLSSLRFCANGAEPVSPETLERFASRFAACGLRREALAPVYGLAEASVGLAVPPLGRGPRIDVIDREAFVREGRAEPCGEARAGRLRFVGCGLALPGHEIRIADEAGGELAERREGRLLFRGPSATRGYYRRPDATAQLFAGDWLDSGDRAYLADGEVFVTGRVKDIIIRGGRNLYPHAIEAAVGAVAGVRSGCVVAFGSRDGESGTERLIILAESGLADDGEREALKARIGAAIVESLGEPADEIALVPPHAVLKTSSGKLRRAACKTAWERGELGAMTTSPGWQAIRLLAGAGGALGQRLARRVGEWAYALRVWAAFALLVPLAWPAVALAGDPARGWRVAGRFARAFFRLAGIPLRLEGEAPTGGILVANHASYLDGLVLAALLPHPYAFVAKRELQGHAISRRFLNGLGVHFVERFDAAASAADAERLVERALGGEALAFFPEGTFKAAPGLLPFHLGAFVAAVRAGAPLQPVALRGTRAILRGDHFFPHRGEVTLAIAPTLHPMPQDEVFGEALRLRDACRAAILARCGEHSAD